MNTNRMRWSSGARRVATLWLASLLALAFNGNSRGQDCDANATLSVGHVSAPAGQVAVDLIGSSLCGVTGFSVAVRHDARHVAFVRAEPGPFLKEHAGRQLFFAVDGRNSSGFMSLFAVFGFTTPPVSIPESSVLARLFYRIDPESPPGTFLLRNESRKVGSPPIANIFTTRGSAIRPRLEDGSITVTTCDASASIAVGHARATSGEVSVDLVGRSFCPVTGFTLAVGHGLGRVKFLRAEPGPFLESRVGEDLFFLVEENNLRGFMSLHVAFDEPETTPVTSLTIPADSILATLFYDIPRGVAPGEIVLRNEGGVFGNPPIANVFTTGESSVLEPELEDGSITIAETVEIVSEFSRGDANGDGVLDLSDAVTMITLRTPGAVQSPCPKASDANDDGRVNLADALFLLNFLSGLGPAPPAPFPQCGPDRTPDELRCTSFPRCASR